MGKGGKTRKIHGNNEQSGKLLSTNPKPCKDVVEFIVLGKFLIFKYIRAACFQELFEHTAKGVGSYCLRRFWCFNEFVFLLSNKADFTT